MSGEQKTGVAGEDIPLIEVGCGIGKDSDAYAAGRQAAEQAMATIVMYAPSVAMVFASVSYEPEAMLAGIRSVVGDVPLLGASSAGEICNRSLSGSVAVMVLASPYLRVSLGIGRDVSSDWRRSVREAVGHGLIAPFFSSQDSGIYDELTKEGWSSFAMLFTPGSTWNTDSHSPEILEELKDLSQGRIPFFGGAAYDDLNTGGEINYVFYGDRACRDSFVIAVFETSLRFGIAIGHGLHPTAKRAVATKVQGCIVLEMDGKPAADAFAALHELPRGSLEGMLLFEQLSRPFGVRHALGQYTIYVPRSLTPDGGVLLAHPAPEGVTLVVMETVQDDLVAAGKDTLLRAMMHSGISRPAAILVCSCFLRMHLLQDRLEEEVSAITEIIPDVPIVGFYSAGEQGMSEDHVSRHNNEAIGILLLGNELSYAAQVAGENRRLQEALEWRLAEQQRLETALAEQVRFLQTLIDNIPNPVFYKDAAGKYLGCNKAFERYFGVRRKEILGKTVGDLPGIGQKALHEGMDATLREKGGSVLYESTIRLADDLIIHVINQKSLFHKSDASPGGIIGCLTDITDRKRAEEERVNRMKLQSALNMAGTVCHELNQPMQILTGYTDLLLYGDASDPRVSVKLQSMKEQLSRMEAITRKLMTIQDCSVQDYAGIGQIMDIHKDH